MSTPRATFVLVPGAWMGAWIWADTASRLHAAGHRALTLTLTGLADGTRRQDAAEVTLERHVHDVLDLLTAEALSGVVLVGHSYSGIVVGQVADRAPELVRRSVHLGSFLPRDGLSLLDDWGVDDTARAAESQQIADDGNLWAPPPPEAMREVPDLDPASRDWLASRFTPHPGRTILDPARLDRPVSAQVASYVSLAPPGADSLGDLPPELADELPATWRLRTLASGHWPMVSTPGHADRRPRRGGLDRTVRRTPGPRHPERSRRT